MFLTNFKCDFKDISVTLNFIFDIILLYFIDAIFIQYILVLIKNRNCHIV